MGKLATAVFLKGYQWPFDPRKLANYGSSLIDLLVYRKRYSAAAAFSWTFAAIPKVTPGLASLTSPTWRKRRICTYTNRVPSLAHPSSGCSTMNSMAIELYRQHGIDLTAEPLEIAVCAQHNNGGLQGNIWWESNIKHLFPIGEANGSHGVYRPGGSALNSGQVGGYRAAEYIAEVYRESTFPEEEALAQTSKAVESLLELRQELLRRRGTPGRKMAEFRREMQQRMTAAAAHIRDPQAVKQAIRERERQYELISSGQVCLGDRSGSPCLFPEQTAVPNSPGCSAQHCRVFRCRWGAAEGPIWLLTQKESRFTRSWGVLLPPRKRGSPQADPALPVSRWEASHRVGGSAADTSR